jgi:GH25 family lysozyme M1 (1,4-beta-N-acetylmuramidase)
MANKVSVVDLSHWDTVTDYGALKAAGVTGVIYKATQGSSSTDATYNDARIKALRAGLRWGAYHFGDNTDVSLQVANFLGYAAIDEESLFCLDYEPYTGSQMNVVQAKQWMTLVENGLGRVGESVFYSGNLIKEDLGSKIDPFFGARRLWLAQYGSTAVVQASWSTYWLWQYSGDGEGPDPHTVDGISGNCDCNSYAGTDAQLNDEWAHGVAGPTPPVPSSSLVTITIDAPADVEVKIVYANSKKA